MQKNIKTFFVFIFLFSVLGFANIFAMQCSICKDDLIQEGRGRKTTECLHVFHEDCLKRWNQESLACPVCRKKPSEVIDLEIKSGVYASDSPEMRELYRQKEFALERERHLTEGREFTRKLEDVERSFREREITVAALESRVAEIELEGIPGESDDDRTLRGIYEAMDAMQSSAEGEEQVKLTKKSYNKKSYSNLEMYFSERDRALEDREKRAKDRLAELRRGRDEVRLLRRIRVLDRESIREEERRLLRLEMGFTNRMEKTEATIQVQEKRICQEETEKRDLAEKIHEMQISHAQILATIKKLEETIRASGRDGVGQEEIESHRQLVQEPLVVPVSPTVSVKKSVLKKSSTRYSSAVIKQLLESAYNEAASRRKFARINVSLCPANKQDAVIKYNKLLAKYARIGGLTIPEMKKRIALRMQILS